MSKVTILLLLRLMLCSLIGVGAVIVPHTTAYADGDSDGGDEGDDHDDSDSDHDNETGNDDGKSGNTATSNSGKSHQRTIRSAVQNKQILPLNKIKQIVRHKTKSEIIGIELERKKRRWVYEFKIIDSKGRLRELYVDASNGTILKSKYK